jgi:hypothetical protein
MRIQTERVGFVLLHDTLALGITPAEWDGENPFVLYPTFADAEAERADWAQLRADFATGSAMEIDDEESVWVEPATLDSKGRLSFPALHLTLTRDEMYERLSGAGPTASRVEHLDVASRDDSTAH